MEKCNIPEYILSIINNFNKNNNDNRINLIKETTIQIKNKNYFKSNLFYLEYQGNKSYFEKYNFSKIEEYLRDNYIYQTVLNRVCKRISAFNIKYDRKEDLNLNRKKYNIIFIIWNGMIINDTIKNIKSLLEELRFSEIHAIMSFNVIITNYFEYCNIKNIKSDEIPNEIDINYYFINYSDLTNLFYLKPNQIPKIIITNKLNKCICVLDYFTSMNKLNHITKNLILKSSVYPEIKHTKLYELITESNGINDNYNDFKDFLRKIRNEFISSTCLEKGIQRITVKYKKEYIFENNKVVFKYDKPIVIDNSFYFLFSRINKLLSTYETYYDRIRFSMKISKILKEKYLSDYLNLLNKSNIRTNIEIRKKINYSIENVSKHYFVKNSEGKLNNFELRRIINLNDLFKEIKMIKKMALQEVEKLDFDNSFKNIRIKFLYKPYKSKKSKGLSLEVYGMNFNKMKFQNELGQNYFIFYVKKGENLANFALIFQKLLSLNIYCRLSNLNVKICIFILSNEEILEKVCKEFSSKYSNYKHLIDFYFVSIFDKIVSDNFFDYPKEKSFMFIDSEGNLNNFSFSYAESYLWEKLHNILNPKKIINEKTFYQLKNYLKQNLIDFNYSKEGFNYRPKFKVSLEKRTIYNSNLDEIGKKYYFKSDLIALIKDYPKLKDLEYEMNGILNLNNFNYGIITKKELREIVSINLDLSLVCQFCIKECGNLSIYYCPFCSFFICEKCEKELVKLYFSKEYENEKYKSCIFHNLIYIPYIQNTKKSKMNISIDRHKIGYNIFKENQDSSNKIFFCNMCQKTASKYRYMCLNCRGPELFYDVNNNGYIDLCIKCIKSQFPKENINKRIFDSIGEDMLNEEGHDMKTHIYLRILVSSGFYYFN